MAAFAKEARRPSQFGVWTWPGAKPVLFLVDENVAELVHDARGDDVPKAAWEVLRDDKHVLARLDVSIGKGDFTSWLLADPAMEVVRAAASGPHDIVILPEPPAKDEPPTRKHFADAAAMVVTVRTTSITMGTLLSEVR
jgi:hypothetical protein